MNEEYTVAIPEETEAASDTEADTAVETHESLTQDSIESDLQSTDQDESIEALKAEIEALRSQISELESQRETQAKILEEISDFKALFPTVDIENIPESVWENVKKGTPLIASYALYEKRLAAEEARISQINFANASRSPGIAGRDLACEYFTPDEVKKMSRSEVHANYSKIKESMKKWMEN